MEIQNISNYFFKKNYFKFLNLKLKLHQIIYFGNRLSFFVERKRCHFLDIIYLTNIAYEWLQNHLFLKVLNYCLRSIFSFFNRDPV